ncbi:MAG: hypothetical protein LBP59_01195 [Planctomycetaceae bacterium]|nr:hypothetical protein [Planctomycetaceae bacterium]
MLQKKLSHLSLKNYQTNFREILQKILGNCWEIGIVLFDELIYTDNPF